MSIKDRILVVPEGSVPIKFKLETFEGPLDLLLHLIRINEVDIFDIPIVVITDQYNEYLDLMKVVDIDLSSEFMLMAATLIHIKTKMMLPLRDDEEDPRAELVERLLEHQQYKAAAMMLGEREEAELKFWRRSSKSMEQYQEVDEELVEADIFQLISAFQRVLKSIGGDHSIEIEHQRFNIEDKIVELRTLLKQTKRILFTDLTRAIRGKRELIATFLAILELVRRRFIAILQHKNFGEIVLVVRGKKRPAKKIPNRDKS